VSQRQQASLISHEKFQEQLAANQDINRHCRKANTAHYHCGRPGNKTHDICEAIRKEREKMDNNKTNI